MSTSKSWSGRFDKAIGSLMEAFSRSIEFDYKLFDADIRVNQAWAKALARIGIYSGAELQQVLNTLDQIRSDYKNGKIKPLPEDEDIHSATERWLTERLGEAGARIHTGKSRNDQVNTDVKLFLKEEIPLLFAAIHSFQASCIKLAEDHVNTIMPGYTHLRQAQPVSFSHYILAFFFQVQRDKDRLHDYSKRCDELPLGSGALAGSAFDIDRNFLAGELGFQRCSDNSIDATADRDFITECIYICVQLMLHLSRLAEDFILWSSKAYGFIEIAQEYSTGSSMMPQKRNPDSLELVRGKTARLIGDLNSLMALMKAIPTAYVRDLQEDKEPLFNALYQTGMSLHIMSHVLQTLTVFPQRMASALDPALYATDIADYLVKRGMPFREAHAVVGKVVTWSEKNDTPLHQIPVETWKDFSLLFDQQVYALFDALQSIDRRNIPGGTGRDSVKAQLKRARALLKKNS